MFHTSHTLDNVIDPLRSYHSPLATSTTFIFVAGREGGWGLLCECGVAFLSVCIGCIGAVVAVGDGQGLRGVQMLQLAEW